MRTGLTVILLFLSLFISAQPTTNEQLAALDISEWEQRIGSTSKHVNEWLTRLDSTLDQKDSAECFRFINALYDKGDNQNEYFIARFNCIKARQLYQKNFSTNLNGVKPEIRRLFTIAINNAYETGDNYLIAYVSICYGGLIYYLGETELAVMYLTNGVELNEEMAGLNNPFIYQSLGELLYRIKEYKNSVYYSLKAVKKWEGDTVSNAKGAFMSCLNTVALGYHRQGIYDTAFLFYKRALKVAQEIKNEVWQGIISGNMGQIYYAQQKYDSAIALLQMDYRSSKTAGYFDNAGNSLQWAARAKLSTGDKTAAVSDIREAIQLLKKSPVADYMRNTFNTATEIFASMGNYDSALYYYKLYTKLNDSLERIASLSSLAVSKARLNEEKNRYGILNLQRERKQELVKRNFLVAGILLVSLIALLFVNRQRLRAALKMEILVKEKAIIEQEIDSARIQLKMFTESIAEKTNLIEKLEEQSKVNHLTTGQQNILEELSSQTILTEQEWLKFKSLFEKIHPGFFTRLKDLAIDITIGEQRMAALARLDLTINQMAAILGITADSVRKNRTRLKQRLGLSNEANLGEFINNL